MCCVDGCGNDLQTTIEDLIDMNVVIDYGINTRIRGKKQEVPQF